MMPSTSFVVSDSAFIICIVCTKYNFKFKSRKKVFPQSLGFINQFSKFQLGRFLESFQVWTSSSAGLCRRNCNKQTSHRQGHACPGQTQECLSFENGIKGHAFYPVFHQSAKMNPCFHFSGPDRVSERSKKVWR